MTLAVSFSATGIHAGRIVVHRQVSGMQLWRIKLDIVTPDGVRHEHEAVAPEPIPLSAIGPVAERLTDDLVTVKGLIVKSAKWEAHFAPNPAQRKKPKQRRRR